ncbi:ABC transporter substrate-binding protein [Brevibacterium permense]|uniref:ABC transporter substrate-binding protein n=2 Tax=Brevibacterium permense TaxID=234834 RepID=A0ABN2A4Q5_9MICO
MRFARRSIGRSIVAFALLGVTGCGLQGHHGNVPEAPMDMSVTVVDMPADPRLQAALPDKYQQNGRLLIGTDPTYPPFEYYNDDNTTIIGWDIDFATAVAQVLGAEPRFIAANFDTTLPGLSSGKYDLSISAYGVTAERLEKVDFASYLAGGSGLAVAAGNPEELSLTDQSVCGKKVAVQMGTLQALTQLPDLSAECEEAGKPEIDVHMYPTQSDANLALTAGRVDGTCADSISLTYQGLLANNEFELAPGPEYDPQPTAIALPKGGALTAPVAEAAKQVIDSPVYDQINAKWHIPDSAKISPEEVLDHSAITD